LFAIGGALIVIPLLTAAFALTQHDAHPYAFTPQLRRQQIDRLDYANIITRIVAELSAPYQPEIPYKVVLLDYYGRQLELGLAASRPSTIKQASADLRQTWNSVEPSILERGHVEDARRFTDIVVQIEGAKQATDFVAPVRAELAEVGRLKKIFTP
jgi:hypothetical protein